MNRRFVKSFMFIAAFASVLLLWGRPSDAGPLWTVNVIASAGDDSNRLILGAAPDATDGFENRYEGRAVLAGGLMAYFHHPEWGLDTSYFWSDIKDSTLPKDWVFYVSSQYAGSDITIRWKVDASAPAKLLFVDDTFGTTIDMKAQGSYTYLNSSIAPRKFTIYVSGG